MVCARQKSVFSPQGVLGHVQTVPTLVSTVLHEWHARIAHKKPQIKPRPKLGFFVCCVPAAAGVSLY